MLNLPTGNAICYSGYRHGQSPNTRIYPSATEILEDLLILRKNWRLLRLYDCSPHAVRVLEVIREEKLDLQVMLGAYLGAEMNNFGCPWGATYSPEELEANRAENDAEIERLLTLAQRFDDLVFSVAVGNEATVDWTDHFVPVERMVELVRRVKGGVAQPVTVCENYVPWQHELHGLAEGARLHLPAHLPRLGIQARPRGHPLQQGQLLPGGAPLPGQAGRDHRGGLGDEFEWARDSAGKFVGGSAGDLLPGSDGLDPGRGILTFVFEAFDEPWKGSPDPLEPEKHWGLFTVDRHRRRS